MNPHDSIKSNRPGKHAAAKRDGRHQQATAETRPMAINRPAHTPGPWKNYDNGIRCNGIWSRKGLIADSNHMQDEWKSNALLIASAPEMLETLRGFVRDAERLGDTPDGDPDKLRACKAFLHMVWMSGGALIAKATGGGQ